MTEMTHDDQVAWLVASGMSETAAEEQLAAAAASAKQVSAADVDEARAEVLARRPELDPDSDSA
jgi:hypothetical protein